MVSNVTMETTVFSLMYLNSANVTVLLNNVRKVGRLVISGTSCYKYLGRTRLLFYISCLYLILVSNEIIFLSNGIL
jgi:hypothetical protein